MEIEGKKKYTFLGGFFMFFFFSLNFLNAAGYLSPNISTYILHNESDSQHSNYMQMKNVSTDVSSVVSGTATLVNGVITCWNVSWLAPIQSYPYLVNGTWSFKAYTNTSSNFAVNQYFLFGKILKKNSTGEFNIANTSQVGFAVSGGAAPAVRNWTHNFPFNQSLNLSVGERIGSQICLEIAGGGASNKFGNMEWEGTTNSNITFPITLYDNLGPSVSVFSPSNTTYTLSNISLNYSSYDDYGVGACWYNLDGGANISLPGCLNITISSLADGVYTLRVYSNDSYSNLNFSSVSFSVVSTPPQWSNISTSTPTNYSLNSSFFNIDWVSVNTISSVLLEGNFTGSSQNYSMYLTSGNTYGFNFSLPAGNFYWKSYAIDNYGNMNSSYLQEVIVTKADPSYGMNITGTTPITYGSVSDISGVETNNGDSDCVYSLDKGNQVYAAGNLTFNYSTSGCANYTSGSVSKILTVNKASPSMTLTGNSSIVYGVASDINASQNNSGDSDLSYSLYRSGNLLGNSYDNSVLAAGNYTYMYITSGGQNYSSRGVLFDLIVNRKNSTVSLNFSSPSPQTYGVAVNASCSSDNLAGSLSLFRDGQDVTLYENNINIVLSAGAHSYECNVSQSQNYSSFSLSGNFSIEKALGNVNLYLNGIENNLTIYSIHDSNISATTPYGNLTIYLNGVDITNESGLNVSRGVGLYNVTAISSGDENHSYSTIMRWLNVINDSTPPSLSVISPSNGDVYGYYDDIVLDYSVSDDNLQSCWYNLDYGVNVSLANCQDTTFNVSGSGNYTLNLYANDSYGNMKILQINFSVLLGAPSINIISPINSYLNSTNVVFTYIPSDFDLQTCELWGNFSGVFGQIAVDNSPLNYSQNTFVLNLSDGTYLWNIRCTDYNGHSAFDGNKVFSVDTTSPSINIIEPRGTKNSRIVSSSWSTLDASPLSCKYEVYRSSSVEIPNTSVNCYLSSTSFSVTLDADFVYNFYVNDYAGNVNYSSTSFSVDTTPVPPASGGGSGGSSSGGSVVVTKKPDLFLGKIQPIVVSESGIKKITSLSVKNNGSSFLNDCRFKSEGSYSSWITKTETKGLSAGEEYTFVYDVNIPENINEGKYTLDLSVSCRELKKTTSFDVEITGKQVDFKLIDVQRADKESVRVKYTIKELKGINQNLDLQFLIFNLDNKKEAEIKESKTISANSNQEYETVIPIKESLEGELSLLVNLNSESYSSFVQENIVLGAPLSGLAVLGGGLSKNALISAFMIILFLVFAFFILMRIRQHKRLRW